MKDLIIRKMQIGDHTGLKKNIFTEMEMSQIEKNVMTNVRDMKNDNDWVYLVAEIESEIIGTTYIKFCTSSASNHVAELFSVVTSKNHLRMGVCRALIDKAIEIAKERNIEIITLTVRDGTIADTVYQKLGFKIYGVLKNGIKDKDGYFNQNYYFLKIG